MQVQRIVRSLCLAAGCAAFLGACASSEELHARDQQTCQGYGFTAGTDAFAKCMMTADQKRKDKDAAWLKEQNANWEKKNEPKPKTVCQSSESTTSAGDSMNSTTTTDSSSVCIAQ